MAITWKKSIPNPEGGYPSHIWVDDGVTHVGCVLGAPFTRDTRVMSDIWSYEQYVHVIDPETLTVSTVHLGGAFECNTRSGHAEPDLTPELKARYEAKQAQIRAENAILAAKAAEEQKIREAKAAEKAAARARIAPTKGRRVEVVRGPKVGRGIIGWVFWARDTRVGIALSDKRDPKTGYRTEVAWVPASYCDATPEGNTATEIQARLDADRKSFEDFKKGSKPVPSTLPFDKAPF